MLYISRYKTIPDKIREAQERFKKGGGQPPAGVTLLGRYHNSDMSGGVSIFETDDPVIAASYANQWADVLEMDTRPALTDAELAKVFGG